MHTPGQDFGPFYFIFLTNWALVLETLTTVLLFISTVWAYTVLPNGNTGQKAPLFVRYTVAFWYMIQPISLNLANDSESYASPCALDWMPLKESSLPTSNHPCSRAGRVMFCMSNQSQESVESMVTFLSFRKLYV